MTYSNQTKLECIERELNYRRRAYPRWVADMRMSAAFANEQIRIMEEIAEDMARLAEKERLL